jgi:hypothetical protein
MVKIHHPGTQVVADEDDMGAFSDAKCSRLGLNER